MIVFRYCQSEGKIAVVGYDRKWGGCATNIDGQGCALPGTSLNSQPD